MARRVTSRPYIFRNLRAECDGKVVTSLQTKRRSPINQTRASCMKLPRRTEIRICDRRIVFCERIKKRRSINLRQSRWRQIINVIPRDLCPMIKYDDEVRNVPNTKKNHHSRFYTFINFLCISTGNSRR